MTKSPRALEPPEIRPFGIVGRRLNYWLWPQSRDAPRKGFRPDIEALRAFAVLAVLIYHLQPEWLPGGFAGVDVFFVISGFLITSHLVGELRTRGSISLARFYGRRILRLLPASTLTLLVTLAGVVLFIPRYAWNQFSVDAAGAAAYAVNWILAARSVDYLAEDAIASPVQHYWSLAVEEQFYLLWPVLLLGFAWLASLRCWRLDRSLIAGMVLVSICSFAAAAYAVSAGQPSSYFMTTTRLWELALGGVLAVTAPLFANKFSDAIGVVLGVVGLSAIAFSVSFLDGQGWPAWPALLPTFGAAILIGVGAKEVPTPIQRLLSMRPLIFIGGISYSLYLWHWPLITIARFQGLGFTTDQKAAIALASIVIAWISLRLVENPLRNMRWLQAERRPFGVALACLLLSLGASAAVRIAGQDQPLVAPPHARAVGAAALPERIDLDEERPWSIGVQWVLPAPIDALSDVPRHYRQNCQQDQSSSELTSCAYGAGEGSRTAFVVGDSKIVQWIPALEGWAKRRGIRLVAFTKSTCPFADTTVDLHGAPYASCREWNDAVRQRLVELKPDLVITSQDASRASTSVATGDAGRVAMSQALARSWGHLLSAGARVIVIGDTPKPGRRMWSCVAEHPRRLASCEYDRATAQARSAFPTQASAVRALHGRIIDASGNQIPGEAASRLALIDLSDAICPSRKRCPPVVGNALIYRQGSHITKTYVDTLAPRLSRLLDQAIAN